MSDAIEALVAKIDEQEQEILLCRKRNEMYQNSWMWVQVALGTLSKDDVSGSRPWPGSLVGQTMAAIEERDRLRLRVAELEEKYCNHNVTAILTADGNNRLR